MLLEQLGLIDQSRSAQVIAGLLLGLIFGAAAHVSRFCLRRAVAGDVVERGDAGAVWLTALAAAIIAFAGFSAFGLVDLTGHRFMSDTMAPGAIILGGLMFGAGMVLTRGCISRLTVLSATGNLRAAFVLLILAVAAHAAMKGVLSPLRSALGSVTIEMPFGSVTTTPLGQTALIAIAVIGAAALIRVARPKATHLGLGVLIGLVAAAGWTMTSVLLMDAFDPLPVQSVAFTAPWTDTLFWTIASTATPAGFGVGLIAGVLAGSFVSAAVRGELALVSFESPAQTLRYGAGAMLMGFGGVLAGGCTVGAGLSGVATGSVAAMIALVCIVIGGYITGVVLRQDGARSTLQAVRP